MIDALAFLPLASGGHSEAAASTSPVSYVVFTACIVLLIGGILLLIRALRGPTVFDRILAINALGTKTVVLVALIAFLDFGHAEPGFFLDTGIVYALINFIATIAILKYIQYRRLS